MSISLNAQDNDTGLDGAHNLLNLLITTETYNQFMEK